MADKITSDFIQEVLSRIDIVNVINSHVKLTKAGREYKARCPFHEEKTPSFYVNPAKQFFHCFGCGESGTAISFLMKYSGYRFSDAVEELASSVGMEVPRKFASVQSDGSYQKLLDLMNKVSLDYKKELYRSEGAETARAYLKDRGISFEIAKKYGIGYAPDEWDYLLSKYGTTDGSKNFLEKAGLIFRNEKDRIYDRFRGRLMFPIHDRRGRVIAFGGRVIGQSEGGAKYLNSPETMLFKKGNELFGYHHALPAIRKTEKVLLVEGYTDVVALSQFGVEYAVATLGTAATPNHIKELLRTVPELVFCFDGDIAGEKAAWRAMRATLPMMFDGNMASFVFLPQGHDPDSMIREEGASQFEQRISQGEPIAEFIFRVMLENIDINRFDGKAKLVKHCKDIFSQLPDATFRQLMIKELMQYTSLSKGEVRRALGLESPSASSLGVSRDLRKRKQSDLKLTARALAILIQHPELYKVIGDYDELADLNDSNVQLLVELLHFVNEKIDATTASIVEKFRSSDHFEKVQEHANFEHNVPEGGLESEFKSMISKLHRRLEDQQRRTLKSNLDNDEALKEFNRLLKEKHTRKQMGTNDSVH